MNTPRQQRWDIFCRVVDNFGDIGVSWRLARQLVSEHGKSVRLWVDHIGSLQTLCPEVDPQASRQIVQGVEVFSFGNESGFAQPADVAIEAFGCGLPENYVSAMTARTDKPLWIILEYLSAESWVRDHHGLPSPHPRLNLSRYFFFPGFSEGTGGVLQERDLLSQRDAFDAQALRNWWRGAGHEPPLADAVSVSLFCYLHAPVQALLEACATGEMPVVVAIPDGDMARRMREIFPMPSGNLELRVVPFVPQADYDTLLWACDINFVRGEDSFVRAQWAARPFVWHIYPQAENAHVVKMNAFLDEFCGALPSSSAKVMRDFWGAWNGVSGAPPLADAWQRYCGDLQVQRRGPLPWEARLKRVGNLTDNLVKFCQKMI